MNGKYIKILTALGLVAIVAIQSLFFAFLSMIIARLVEHECLADMMVFTLQKEVAERMTAQPGSSDYSSFSILTQLDYSNSVPLVIRAGSFFPAPRVDSAVVVMRRKESPVRTEDRAGFLSMIRALFSQRRKTVRNNLLSSPVFSQKGREHIENAFSSLGLTGGERAETLSMDTLVSLYDAMK